MHCPKCGSHDLIRSHARGWEIIPRRLLDRKYYQCRKCEWRGGFYFKSKTQIKRTLLIILLVIIVIVVALFLVNYFSLPPAPEETIP